MIETNDGAIHTHLHPADSPDATLAGPAMPIMGLLLGLLDLSGAKTSGITYRGNPTILDRIGGEIDLPTSPI